MKVSTWTGPQRIPKLAHKAKESFLNSRTIQALGYDRIAFGFFASVVGLHNQGQSTVYFSLQGQPILDKADGELKPGMRLEFSLDTPIDHITAKSTGLGVGNLVEIKALRMT